jgi:hypothetical protein
MTMVSMKIKTDDPGIIEGGEYESFPCIYLNDDQCEVLGIMDPPAPGTVYMLKVRAVATRVTAEVEDTDEAPEVGKESSKPDVSLTWQLTDIEILQGGGKDTASMLYGT